MSTNTARKFTLEEYIAIEEASEIKHEFRDGKILAMAGAAPDHVGIVSDLTYLIRSQLRGNQCRVYAADLRVRVTPEGRYSYPDLVVVCGTPVFDDTKPQALINPTLIIEVLSDSTAAYDRGDKFHDYRQVPTLTDYVLVAQDRAYIEHYQRQGESELWLYQAAEGLDATLLISGLNLSLPLVDVYAQADGIA
ncbi:MAG: Uma2 family endonuclease [Armatimonadetes bacterium]|jgi:Uma2 family endonuclease|nr:Uma2 family endonuclease [Armatimonadota bacterium]